MQTQDCDVALSRSNSRCWPHRGQWDRPLLRASQAQPESGVNRGPLPGKAYAKPVAEAWV